MSDASDPDVTEEERRALHDFQVGIEYVYRSYGALLDFHHHLGHAMDRLHDAEEDLRAAGHEELADELRDEHLPAGAVEDMWSYEIVESFREGFLREITDFEAGVRDDLADGRSHVTERRQQREWRERAESENWDDY
ncbi:hypothetical protein [Halegenticoccus tardaugens]|uniref:hypothetical protein n=1 Tax=Halegenticoccus tardaugens TaxID=2071624 RepID=UPI00100BA8E0|nr:hypothetical protein [Halegenticoccus tardaugens]